MRVVTTTPARTLPGAVIRQCATLDLDRNFVAFNAALGMAFTELANQPAERESLLSRVRRRWKVVLSVIS